jgi:hypothetical protein
MLRTAVTFDCRRVRSAIFCRFRRPDRQAGFLFGVRPHFRHRQPTWAHHAPCGLGKLNTMRNHPVKIMSHHVQFITVRGNDWRSTIKPRHAGAVLYRAHILRVFSPPHSPKHMSYSALGTIPNASMLCLSGFLHQSKVSLEVFLCRKSTVCPTFLPSSPRRKADRFPAARLLPNDVSVQRYCRDSDTSSTRKRRACPAYARDHHRTIAKNLAYGTPPVWRTWMYVRPPPIIPRAAYVV